MGLAQGAAADRRQCSGRARRRDDLAAAPADRRSGAAKPARAQGRQIPAQPAAAAGRPLSALLPPSSARGGDRRDGRLQRQSAQPDRALVRLLPATHRLHIRAHPAGLGDFPMRWCAGSPGLPGVVIVDPFTDIWPQMKGSSATVTVCGTVLFEAALLGVPALGLGSVHFSELFAVPASRRSTPLDWPLEDILDPARREPLGPRRARPDRLSRQAVRQFRARQCRRPAPARGGAQPSRLATARGRLPARHARPDRRARPARSDAGGEARLALSPAETRSRRPAGNSGRGASRSRNPPP